MGFNPFREIEKPGTKKKGITLEIPKEIPIAKKEDTSDSLFGGISFNADNFKNLLDEELMAQEAMKKQEAAAKRADAKELKKLQDDAKKLNTSTGDGKDEPDERFYEKRFEDSLDSLTDLETELSGFKDEIKQDLSNIKSSKQRGVLTHVTNQTANVLSSYKAILDIKKEKTAILKTISDLEIKKIDKTKAAQGGLMSESALMDQVFNRVIGGGDPSLNTGMDFDDDGELKAITRNAIASGDLEFTDNELAVAYEKSAQIVVLMDAYTQEWRFAAIDTRTEQEIEGYPLPSMRSSESIKFNLETRKAKDNLNRSYDIWLI